MSKTIKITDNNSGVLYTLQFTRDSVARLEKSGFNIREVSDKPVSMIPVFFKGAFLANHRMVSGEVIDKLYEQLSDKDLLLEKLIEMYLEVYDSMGEDPDKSNQGNVSWEAD